MVLFNKRKHQNKREREWANEWTTTKRYVKSQQYLIFGIKCIFANIGCVPPYTDWENRVRETKKSDTHTRSLCLYLVVALAIFVHVAIKLPLAFPIGNWWILNRYCHLAIFQWHHNVPCIYICRHVNAICAYIYFIWECVSACHKV